MKRFWTTVAAVPNGAAHAVELDGRPVKLPSGQPLILPCSPLADAIAAEWASARADFTPDDLPLTRLASTAQERIVPHRAVIIGQIAAYGMNDLLCYRAKTPEALVARQQEAWQPWLQWAQSTYGIAFLCTAGIVPINQPSGTNEALQAILTAQNNYIIAALGVIVPALGSLVLGLGLTANALDPRTACQTAALDELWQEEQWGTDDEAVKRRVKIFDDVAVSTRFMSLCRP